MKRLEDAVIGTMRAAIASWGTDDALVRESLNAAHTLCADHLMEWSADFATLWQQMYEIYCAFTPMPKGHYRTTHIGIGYSSFPVTRWIDDKIQPPIPTPDELIIQFDRLISGYASAKRQHKRSNIPSSGKSTPPICT